MLLPLRFPRLWVTLGWFFVVLAIYFCLAPGGIPGMEKIDDKAMHIGGYLALTLWFTGIYPRSRYAVIAILLLIMGIAIEILQGTMHMGRNAEVRDVYADVVGIASGIALAFFLLGGWARWVERWVEMWIAPHE